MSGPGPEQVFLVNESVAHREVEGQLLLLLPDEYELYTLNASGKLAWRALAEGRTLGEAAALLADRYRIPLAKAEADVRALVADLEARAVLRRA
jgi:hypothetical protein